MNINTIILIILVLPFVSCNNRDTTADHNQKKDTIIVEKDIPVNKKGRSDLYEMIVSERNYLGDLDILENGFDSIQIRLWYEYWGEKPKRHIVTIKKTKDWSAELQDIEFYRNDDTAYLAKRDIKYGVPKIGWPKFMDSLFRLNILTLPDQRKVPKMDIIYNTSVIVVEIGTKNLYRFYAYTVPREYIDKFSQARDIEKIMDLIEEQLGFKRIHKI